MLLLAGCLVQSEILLQPDEETTIARLSRLPAAETPRGPAFAGLAATDYGESLRRIVVRYTAWFSLSNTEPTPLFSERQRIQFSQVMAREVPRLTPDQRLEFQFKDARQQLDVVMTVHGEGDFLVFRFSALARDINAPITRNQEAVDQADLVPQAGQELSEAVGVSILKEPMGREVVSAARTLQGKHDLISRGLKENLIGNLEAGRLLEIMKASPRLPLGALRTYMEKRKTLALARKQALLTQEEFRIRLERLLKELQN